MTTQNGQKWTKMDKNGDGEDEKGGNEEMK
jgi:hypothetical protein